MMISFNYKFVSMSQLVPDDVHLYSIALREDGTMFKIAYNVDGTVREIKEISQIETG